MHTEIFDSNPAQRKKQLHNLSFHDVWLILNHIKQQKDNVNWLQQNDRAIKDIIDHSMYHPQIFPTGLEVTIELWDYIQGSNDLKEWERIMRNGSLLAQDTIATRHIIGTLNDILNKPNVPVKLKRFFKLQNTNSDALILLRGYQTALNAMVYDLDKPIKEEFIVSLINAALSVNRIIVFAEIYAALARAYAARSNYDEAMRYADTSYKIYEDLRDEGGMARATYARTLAKRLARFPLMALKDHLQTVRHNAKSGAISLQEFYLQEGGIQYELDDFESSIVCYEKCLELLDKRAIDKRQHKIIYAKCLHGIALCKIWLGEFEDASNKLNRANILCVELDAKHLLANNVYIRGFLEGRRMNVPKSEMLLQKALQLADKLDEESARVDLRASILDTLEKLRITGGGDKLHNATRR